ncbi:MAG TPA: homoserine kinase [Solirubrobacterales bacterium]|nr:homoserine kinase [Solirubrobacterales bacterium]
MTARRRLVRVPASSANLGPGYDVMAAALDLFLELEVEETGEFGFEPGPVDVPTGRDNLLVRAFETLHSADGIAFRLKQAIPLGRGLGSSAAAIVAGLVAADHLYELALSREELLARAAEIEGHPDNVAAAIYGGFVVCDPDPGDEPPECSRLPPPDGLEGVLVIPAEEVPTERAREAIPDEVPLGDALSNVFSAARLVLGLSANDPGLIAAGLVDRIHQGRRRDLYPRSMELVEEAGELGALGATISGAGPTVLVWTTWQDAGKVSEELERRCAGWAEVRRTPFTPLGADVPEL